MQNSHVIASCMALVRWATAFYMSIEIVHRTTVLATEQPGAALNRSTKMTTINMGRATVRNHGLSATPGLMGSIKSYLARSHAEKQLRQLDDRLLADIGLKRADIGKSIWGR
jgi:uncharacterized protein YjiS (DUF1127 family)